MKRRFTNSFAKLHNAVSIESISKGNKVIVGFEGSSRSSKSRSIINFLLLYSEYNEGKGKVIRIFRDERVNCMGTIYEDFMAQVNEFEQFDPRNLKLSAPTTYTHFGNRFIFMGCDELKAHGGQQHISYFNEALDIDKPTWDQINMRTEDMTIMDWNPRVSDHWVFDLEKRDDAIFLHSTFKDNALIPPSVKKEIMAYDPNNPVNVAQCSADDYMWKVYGLGLRCSQAGLIFPYVNWITEFPEDVERIWYGLDFGFTNEPSALVKIARKGNDVYLQELLYSPTDSSALLYEIIHPIVRDSTIWADSADRYVGNQGSEGMVKELQKKGMKIFKVKKFPGSVQFGIDIMKRFRLNIVKTKNFAKEQDNYSWRSIHGIQINEPIGEFDHLWSAARYGCQMELAKRKGFTI